MLEAMREAGVLTCEGVCYCVVLCRVVSCHVMSGTSSLLSGWPRTHATDTDSVVRTSTPLAPLTPTTPLAVA